MAERDARRVTMETVEQAQTVDELDEIRRDILARMVRIDNQVATVKAEHIKTGNYADPDWYRKAISAKRILMGLMTSIKARKKELNREVRREEYEVVKEIIRERYGEGTLQDILLEAQGRIF